RDQQPAGQEPGAGDVGDAPVDDHAGIKQDGARVGFLRFLFSGGGGMPAAVEQIGEKTEEIVLAGDKDGYAQITEDDHANEGKNIPQRRRQPGDGKSQQGSDDKATN